MRIRRFAELLALCATIGAAASAPAGQVQGPGQPDATRFAVIGDTGTGDKYQDDVARVLLKSRDTFPFTFVIMMGDNLYGTERPQDYVRKFEQPYKPLLDAKVNFYATLGNHDDPNQRLYKPFNMNGERYYTFTKGPIRFFVLDSNYMDRAQLSWLESELKKSTEQWKMAYFHHPMYSSGGRHGSEVDLRDQLEPLFLKYGMDVVFAGHEHFYERIKPQKGIAYFILGNSAKLRRGDLLKTNLTAKGWDLGYGFMLMEIVGDDLTFQMISDKGETIDTGSVHRVGKTEPTPGRSSQPVQQGPTPPKPPASK
jgi:predicted phosphodiesterase